MRDATPSGSMRLVRMLPTGLKASRQLSPGAASTFSANDWSLPAASLSVPALLLLGSTREHSTGDDIVAGREGPFPGLGGNFVATWFVNFVRSTSAPMEHLFFLSFLVRARSMEDIRCAAPLPLIFSILRTISL